MLFQLNVSHLAACCASSSYSAVKHASLSTYLSRNVSASARRSAVALVHVELSVRFLSGQCRVADESHKVCVKMCSRIEINLTTSRVSFKL